MRFTFLQELNRPPGHILDEPDIAHYAENWGQ